MTRYRYLTTIQPVVEEDTSLAPIEGLINKNISLKPLDLRYSILIFIIVLKS
jgi:hypothetical protein